MSGCANATLLRPARSGDQHRNQAGWAEASAKLKTTTGNSHFLSSSASLSLSLSQTRPAVLANIRRPLLIFWHLRHLPRIRWAFRKGGRVNQPSILRRHWATTNPIILAEQAKSWAWELPCWLGAEHRGQGLAGGTPRGPGCFPGGREALPLLAASNSPSPRLFRPRARASPIEKKGSESQKRYKSFNAPPGRADWRSAAESRDPAANGRPRRGCSCCFGRPRVAS